MAEEFIDILTEEHRQLRDVLLELIDAFENGDSERASVAIEAMAALAAPHFHYEQEVLYPALAEVHGDEQVEQLVEQHGEAVAAAQQLAELAEQEEFDEQAAAYGAELARQLLPHVSNGDELMVMVGGLEPHTIKKIHKAQKQSKKSGATLAGLAKSAAKKGAKKKIERKAAHKRSAKPVRTSTRRPNVPKSAAGAKRRRK